MQADGYEGSPLWSPAVCLRKEGKRIFPHVLILVSFSPPLQFRFNSLEACLTAYRKIDHSAWGAVFTQNPFKWKRKQVTKACVFCDGKGLVVQCHHEITDFSNAVVIGMRIGTLITCVVVGSLNISSSPVYSFVSIFSCSWTVLKTWVQRR